MEFAAFRRILALALLVGAVVSAHVAAASQLLRGQVPEAVARLHPSARLDAGKRLSLAIGLPLRNGQGLTNFLRDLYDPASPAFHKYLTADQFAEQFGPTKEDYAVIRRFAEAHGLTVIGAHPNRILLDVNGTVADIEKAFHLHLRVYPHPTEARNFFAPDAEPSLDLDVPVLTISGLDNYILPHPMDLKAASFHQKASAATVTDTTAFATGSGPSGYFIGGDFRAAYAPGVTLNGTGQSVGLFELDGYFPSDITDYEILSKLPHVPLTNILVDGFSGTAGGDNIEVALDIDMAICMAPGLSQVLVYEGTTPNDILNRMATDNQARQLSSSWGFPINASTELIYLQFAAQGQSMFQASGDSGAYGGANTMQPPCDDPNLTVVGGTSLTTAGPGGAWASETTWSGSGGGISPANAIPIWQQGVSMSANHGSTTKRNIPDVSCLADISIWLIADDGNQGAIGGSSASTPLWAGFAALVNQQAAANGRSPIGFINPAIYAIGEGSAFHDITTGNNANASNPTNFFAVPGYDLCTGWGSPTGSNLINALALPPDALRITPATNLVLSGAVGGPFSPAGAVLVLTNIGANSLNWSAGDNVSWLNYSPLGGTLAAAGPGATVTLTPNSFASNLPAGSYAATVTFTNVSDGFTQSRTVTLDVVTAPVINQQPVNQNVPLGGTATFSVGTTSNALLFFQWQDNGTNLSDGSNIFGSATATLVLSNVSPSAVGAYRVVVSNAANVVVSSGATLSITSSAPVILNQPASQAALQGGTAVFAVTAAGNAPLSYQWHWNQTNLTDGGNVSGSSSSALTLMNVQPSNAGNYSVTVSNSLGLTASSNAALTIVSLTAPGVSISAVYSFTGGLDGGNPNGLMQETNGNFYGTTQVGGSNAVGTVFQLTPAGAITMLHSFSAANNAGYSPVAALAQGPDGNLYGSTRNGGTSGAGIIFKTTTNGVQTKLVNFNGSGNGARPAAAMIPGADGALYGTTQYGGANSDGTAFRLTTSGGFTTLAAFNYQNGAEPTDLTQAANGNLYGTTFEGGANGNGTVFQLTTNGALTSLTSFTYTNGGSLPYGGVAQATGGGDFFGTTYEGGVYGYGTVYEMSPAGVITTLYSFTGASDGGHPSTRLTQAGDGNFYGTTVDGGTYGDGTVFRITPDGVLVSLLQFDGYDGANPQSALIQGQDGALYGAALNGGVDGAGIIFRVNINFPGLQISSQPVDQQAFVGANATFSVAVIGNGPLTYQWRQDGTNLTDGPGISGSSTRVLNLLNVNISSSGLYSVAVSNSTGAVVSDDAVLGVIVSPPQITVQPASQSAVVGSTAVFTVTAIGDVPFAYQWQKNGSNLTDGGQISGSSTSALTLSSLVETNDGTYSVIVSNAIAQISSSAAVLTVFAASAGGTTMATVYSFTGGNDGGTPNGLVVNTNGILYGTTQDGGGFGEGTVFSLSANGTLTTLVSFNETNGAMPLDALTPGTNGILYGTTEYGGSNSAGTIFSMTTNGVLHTVFSFASNISGVNPTNALALGADGNFYGSAQIPGSSNATIFKITPNGLLTNLYTFSGNSNGTAPAGELTLAADGNFYGVTGFGGADASGNVFKMTPGGILTNLYSFTGGTNGIIPSGQLVQGTDGNFYGVTRSNTIANQGAYGTIYKITPGGSWSLLYTLNDAEPPFTDGAIPMAGLIQARNGNFYGTTVTGLDIDDNGAIYNSSYGTVFQITPTGTITTLTAFNDSDDGIYPKSALVEGPDGSLYGTTSGGGPGGQGTIFRIAFTSAPQLTTQPVNQTVIAGSAATFNVTVFGAPQLFYQWRQNGTNLVDGGSISGSTSRVLTITNTQTANAGTYSVIVSNALGTVTSASALLTVQVPPPMFLTATQASGIFTFTWNAAVGKPYQVQYNTSLSGSSWSNFGAAVIATNSVMGSSDIIQNNARKFYRIVLLP